MRLVQPPIEQHDAEQAAYYRRVSSGLHSDAAIGSDGQLQGPALIHLFSPVISEAYSHVTAALHDDRRLPDRAFELVILTIAAHERDEFIWCAHARYGRDAGLTPDEIEAIRTGKPDVVTDPVEHAAYAVATALLRRRDLDDAEFEAASRSLDTRQLIEVSTLVGHYMKLAMQMRMFRVGAPEGAPKAFAES